MPGTQTPSILTELHPFREPTEGRARLNRLLQQLRSGTPPQHLPALEQLAHTAPTTPALIFNLDRIAQRMLSMKTLASGYAISPLIAVKSCPQREYLEVALKHLDGFDVSNLNEYEALPHDLGGRIVSLTAPALTDQPADFLARGNLAVTCLDSQYQLEYFLSRTPTMPYLLRIQGSELLKDTSPADSAYYPSTRFGIAPAECRQLLQQPALQENPPAGFHVHHGSERNQASTYRGIIDGLARLAKELPEPVSCINLGGGWHAMTASDVEHTLRLARTRFPEPCRILIEPGRWYAEDAGFATGTIVNRAQDNGTLRLTLDLSGKSHLHWSQARLLHKVDLASDRATLIQFYGPSCYESDFIGQYLVPHRKDQLPADIGFEPGVRVTFSGISTYSVAWNTAFNGVPRAEVIWSHD